MVSQQVPATFASVEEILNDPGDHIEAFMRATEFIQGEGWERLVYWNHNWNAYTGGCYTVIPHDELAIALGAFVKKTCGDDSGYRDIKSMLETICLVRGEVRQDSWIGEGASPLEPPFISFENGILHPVSSTFVPHSPDWFLRYHPLPCRYDPKAESPLWDWFLLETLPERDDRLLLQEIFGYCLSPGNDRQRFFCFHGPPAAGKGTIFRVLRRLMGDHNCTGTSMDQLGQRFGNYNAAHALLNLAGELHPKRTFPENLVNLWTGEDPIDVEKKGVQAITMVPKSKLLFTANDFVALRERTQGIWRRLIILGFTRVIPEADWNRGLSQELYGELPGIARWAIEGRRRLDKQNGFTKSARSVELKAELRDLSRPEERFLKEHVAAGDALDFVVTLDLYGAYRSWFASNGLKGGTLDSREFGKALVTMFLGAERKRKRLGGKRSRAGRQAWVYFGIKLLDVPVPGTPLV